MPQFVLFGFDDNAFADGVNWVREQMTGRKNADGSAARVTFFLVAGFADSLAADDTAAVLAAWKGAYADGHEIGNHTWDHAANSATGMNDVNYWTKEITDARTFIEKTSAYPTASSPGSGRHGSSSRRPPSTP